MTTDDPLAIAAAALQNAARRYNTTSELSPAELYETLGNLNAIVGPLWEVQNSLVRTTKACRDLPGLYDTERDPLVSIAAAALALEGAADSTGVAMVRLQQAHEDIATVGLKDT